MPQMRKDDMLLPSFVSSGYARELVGTPEHPPRSIHMTICRLYILTDIVLGAFPNPVFQDIFNKLQIQVQNNCISS